MADIGTTVALSDKPVSVATVATVADKAAMSVAAAMADKAAVANEPMADIAMTAMAVVECTCGRG